jgi:hypothetical protein
MPPPALPQDHPALDRRASGQLLIPEHLPQHAHLQVSVQRALKGFYFSSFSSPLLSVYKGLSE